MRGSCHRVRLVQDHDFVLIRKRAHQGTAGVDLVVSPAASATAELICVVFRKHRTEACALCELLDGAPHHIDATLIALVQLQRREFIGSAAVDLLCDCYRACSLPCALGTVEQHVR